MKKATLFFAIIGVFTISSAFAQLNWSGTYTYNSTTTISQNITLTGNVTIVTSGGAILFINGIISGDSNYTLTIEGSVALNGVNSYTGRTIIAGSLRVNANGSIASSSEVYFASYGTLSIYGNQTIKAINTPSSTANRRIYLDYNSTLTFGITGQNNGDGTYSGTIEGEGGITKAGSGTLTLLGNNTYTGATTVAEGTLQVGNGTTATSINSTSQVNLQSASSTIKFMPASNTTHSKVISGSGKVEYEGSPIKTLTLSAVNTYTGSTSIVGGTLILDASGNIAPSNSVILNSNTAN